MVRFSTASFFARFAVNFYKHIRTLVPGTFGPISFVIFISSASSLSAAPPQITNCPNAPITNSHCNTFVYDFNALDSDGEFVTYSRHTGLGQINSSNGFWTWSQADETHVGASLVLGVIATSADGADTCEVTIVVTNTTPQLTSGCRSIDSINTLQTTHVEFPRIDDCGSVRYNVIPVTPHIMGNFSVSNTGLFTYTPELSDTLLPQPLEFQISVSDAAGAADSCPVFVYVSGHPLVELRIVGNDRSQPIIPDESVVVPILLTEADPIRGISGFDLLIAYDNSILQFQGATAGSLYDQCEWEYFTFRFGSIGNCTVNCPSAVIRVVGLWDTGMPGTPPCNLPPVGSLPVSLALLEFRTSNNFPELVDTTYLRFYWLDCGDNVVITNSDRQIVISEEILDPPVRIGEEPIRLTSSAGTFPTYHGAASSCLSQTPNGFPARDARFYNARLYLYIGELRGDINLNGNAFELADVLLYIQVIKQGITALSQDLRGQTILQMAEINQDGAPFTISDLILMINIVYGQNPTGASDAQSLDSLK